MPNVPVHRSVCFYSSVFQALPVNDCILGSDGFERATFPLEKSSLIEKALPLTLLDYAMTPDDRQIRRVDEMSGHRVCGCLSCVMTLLRSAVFVSFTQSFSLWTEKAIFANNSIDPKELELIKCMS